MHCWQRIHGYKYCCDRPKQNNTSEALCGDKKGNFGIIHTQRFYANS